MKKRERFFLKQMFRNVSSKLGYIVHSMAENVLTATLTNTVYLAHQFGDPLFYTFDCELISEFVA